MPCGTCSHTLESLGTMIDRRRFWWCPRCGTLVMENTDDAGEVERVTVDTPKLVARCREFETQVLADAECPEWRTLGIAEAINLPGSRREDSCSTT